MKTFFQNIGKKSEEAASYRDSGIDTKRTFDCQFPSAGLPDVMEGPLFLNFAENLPMNKSKTKLTGRTAEELAIGDITTGAENDLVDATRLTRRMIIRWGMGSLGLMAVASDDEQPFLGYELTQDKNYSEETGARIDRDIQKFLNERHEMVRNLLSKSRDKLDSLVNVLLQEETVNQDELTEILGHRVYESVGV